MSRLSGVFWAALLAAALAFPSAAHAVTFTVTRLDDPDPPGACDEDCSLREAILAANAAPGSRNVVSLPAGVYQLAIPRTTADATTGDLDITRPLEVVGAGRDDTIVDGGALDGVFRVVGAGAPPGFRTRFKHLTIRNGNTAGIGGAISVDIAYAQVYVLDCAIVDNTAAGDGGGIATYGYTLTVQDSLIEGNVSGNRGGGVAHYYNYGQPGKILRSVVRDNKAAYNGGGVANFGNMRIEDALFDGNLLTANGSGGGLFTSNAFTSVRNSTFTANTAGTGGAFQTIGSSASFTNVTVTANLDNAGGDGFYYSVSAPTTMANMLFADNMCATPGPGVPLAVTSEGGNVETSNTCGLGGGPGDVVNAPDAGVDALADNGGRSQTHALLPGSPAIGAAVPELCPFTDQRGFIRDEDCDAGAFEAGATAGQACGMTTAAIAASLEIGVAGVSEDPVGTVELCLQALAGYP